MQLSFDSNRLGESASVRDAGKKGVPLVAAWIGLGVVFLSRSLPAAITPGEYGPVFEESGVPAGGDLFSVTPEVAVNLYGGAAIIRAEDVSIPSVGDLPYGFSRVHSSNGRSDDGPMGRGWVGHYGFLRRDSSTARFEFINGSGGRELFYAHDVSALRHLKPTAANVVGISPSLLVLERENPTTYHMYTPGGLRYTFEFHSAGRFALTNIRDKSGNQWNITYKEKPNGGWWWTHYPNHPVIAAITEDAGQRSRTLNFVYDSSTPPRLQRVTLGDVTLMAYRYETVNASKYLRYVETPTGRLTEYDYNNTNAQAADYETLRSVTVPTGGTTLLSYEARDYVYSISEGRVSILAVTKLQKVGEQTNTWTFRYPDVNASADQFEVSISGPSYTSTRKFHSYKAGTCTYTEHWRVGRLVSMSETLARYSRSASYTWDGMQVSTDPVFTECGWRNVFATRLKETRISEDGFTTTATVNAFHLLLPEDESTNTRLATLRDMHDWITPDSIVVGLVDSETQRFGTATVGQTKYSNFELGQPKMVQEYRNATDRIVHSLTYYRGSLGRGRLGRVKTETTGSYSEEYDYEYGVLSSIDYPSGPDLSRDVSALGKIEAETAEGHTTSYHYDDDGRPTGEIPELNDAKTIVYSGNTATVTQGSTWKQTTLDKWGRIATLKERVDGTTVQSSYTYDPFGREETITNPRGLVFALSHDVQGRMRSKSSNLASLDIDIAVSSGGVRTTTRKNDAVSLVELRDFAGRYKETLTNGKKVTFSYTSTSEGIKQTVKPAAGGPARSMTFDWLGNRVENDHPEMDFAVKYEVDARGWLTGITQPMGDSTITYYNHGGIEDITRTWVIPSYQHLEQTASAQCSE